MAKTHPEDLPQRLCCVFFILLRTSEYKRNNKNLNKNVFCSFSVLCIRSNTETHLNKSFFNLIKQEIIKLFFWRPPSIHFPFMLFMFHNYFYFNIWTDDILKFEPIKWRIF